MRLKLVYLVLYSYIRCLYRNTTVNHNILSRDGLAQHQSFHLIRNILHRRRRFQHRLVRRSLDLVRRKAVAPVVQSASLSFYTIPIPQPKIGRERNRNKSPKIKKGAKTHHSVIINPGLTLLHLTPLPQIIASPLVKWISAAFVTLYGRLLPLGLTPARLATVTKAPPSSLFSRCGLAAYSSHRCDLTLTLKHRSQSSSRTWSSRSRKFVSRVQPLLLTTTSRRPMVLMVSETRRVMWVRSETSAWMLWKRGSVVEVA